MRRCSASPIRMWLESLLKVEEKPKLWRCVEVEGFLAVEGCGGERYEPGEDGDDCSLAQTETPRDAEGQGGACAALKRRIQYGRARGGAGAYAGT
jgi:hypothetical protein